MGVRTFKSIFSVINAELNTIFLYESAPYPANILVKFFFSKYMKINKIDRNLESPICICEYVACTPTD